MTIWLIDTTHEKANLICYAAKIWQKLCITHDVLAHACNVQVKLSFIMKLARILRSSVTSPHNVIGNDENVLQQTFIIYNLAPEPF